jgi:hypothetical protein
MTTIAMKDPIIYSATENSSIRDGAGIQQRANIISVAYVAPDAAFLVAPVVSNLV